MEISFISLGSSQTFLFPQSMTDAARRFWVLRLTLDSGDALSVDYPCAKCCCNVQSSARPICHSPSRTTKLLLNSNRALRPKPSRHRSSCVIFVTVSFVSSPFVVYARSTCDKVGGEHYLLFLLPSKSSSTFPVEKQTAANYRRSNSHFG